MKARIRTMLIVLALVGAGVGAWFLLFEKAEITDAHPPVAEARANKFLALVRLMELRGMQVTSEQALSAHMLQGRESVVWMTGEHINLVARNRAVAQWLREGGRLVLADGWSDDDPLIEELRDDFEPDSVFQPAQLLGPYLPEKDECYGFEPGEVPLLRGWALACEDGESLAVIGPYGQGTLGLLAQSWRFENTSLENTGAVDLYWDTLRLTGIHGEVLFVYGEATTGWMTLLWRHGKPLLLSLFILSLAWLLHASRRFGPLLPPRPRESRSLIEHVAATGSLLWRQGARDLLLDSVRSAVRHRITVSRADLAFLDDDELAPHLAALAALSTADVLAALSAPAPQNPTAFARHINHLQQLRAALGGSS